MGTIGHIDELARLRRVKAFDRDSISVLNALRRYGIFITNLSSLVDIVPIPLHIEVVNILLEQLLMTDNPNVQEWMVRPIGATRTPYDGRPLAHLFDTSTDASLKWAIGNTLSLTTPQNIEEWIPGALRDSRHGRDREMLCDAAARIIPDTAGAPLMDIFDEMPGHVASGLAKCGGATELEFLRKKQEHPETWHTWEKKEVARAIARIEKRLSKPIRVKKRSPKKANK